VEAAALAGFADQSHLTRWFGRYFGITPAAYRRAAAAQ
jgi:AraC-like DNA-binding protein